MVCAGLAAVVAYQLSVSFPLAPMVTAAPPSAPALELAERPPLPRAPDDEAVDTITARPLFSESRRPYVPPPAVVEAGPEPVQPSSPLELAGTFLTGTDQAALLLVSGETAEWLRKGQLIDGWRVEVIEQDQVRLRKGEREQVVQLREDVAVMKAPPPAGRRAKEESATMRRLGSEPGNEDNNSQD
jgi:hypothetical protein